MQVSGQLDAPAALHLVPIVEKAEWAPRARLDVFRDEKFSRRRRPVCTTRTLVLKRSIPVVCIQTLGVGISQ
jgi:hypothetical protein